MHWRISKAWRSNWTTSVTQTLVAAYVIAIFIFPGSTARGQVAVTIDPTEAFREYSHQIWQAENGLSEDSIQAISQSADGLLWLGTERGLVRFDGLRFKVFSHQNVPRTRRQLHSSSLFGRRRNSLDRDPHGRPRFIQGRRLSPCRRRSGRWIYNPHRPR